MVRSIEDGRWRLFTPRLFLFAALAIGCQRDPSWELSLVEGTVTKDGLPLGNVQVVFLADAEAGTQGPHARGTTDENGHYCLRTDNGDEGVVVGKHRVLLFDDASPVLARGKESAKGKRFRKKRGAELLKLMEKGGAVVERIPPWYGDFSKTPLRVEVQPGRQVINLAVTPGQ